MDNKVHELETIASISDGNDVIDTSDGTQVIFGGSGADIITVADGINTVFGDNGFADFDSSVQLISAESRDADTGGVDILSLGHGVNVVFAGAGDETISLSGGLNAIVGDAGRLAVADDGTVTIESLDIDAVANDTCLLYTSPSPRDRG